MECTLAGGVLAAYIAFLGGDDPVERLKFAKHLLAVSFGSSGAGLYQNTYSAKEAINSKVEVTKKKLVAMYLILFQMVQ